MIFNIVVDTVVRAVLDVVCVYQEDQHGLGWAVGERNVIFCADDSRIVVRDDKWVQDALPVVVEIFRRVGLDTNLDKSKSMVCTPRYIWGKWGEQAYKIWVTGEGATYREWKMLRVSCAQCGLMVAQSYLNQHMTSLHEGVQ